MERIPCVYLLASGFHGTLYTGVTSDLSGRIWQHREEVTGGFMKRYGVKRLVWFEVHEVMETAIRDFGFDPLIKKRWIPAQGRGDEE